jgi:hypothetical protein
MRHVGHVEISNALEVVVSEYFPLKEKCLMLLNGNSGALPRKKHYLHEKKDQILWGCDEEDEKKLVRRVERAAAEPPRLRESKKKLVKQVDRSTRGELLTSFFDIVVEHLHPEMSREAELKSGRLWRLLAQVDEFIISNSIMLLLAVLQNTVLLLRYSSPENPKLHAFERIANISMGSLQCLCCIANFLFM